MPTNSPIADHSTSATRNGVHPISHEHNVMPMFVQW